MRRVPQVAIALAFVALVALVAGCASGASHASDYATRATFPLTRGPDAIDGTLELLEDARIQPEMREAIADVYGEDPCADHPPATLQSLCDDGYRPLRPAMLRLLDAKGRVLATRVTERALADLVVTQLYGTPRRTYELTVDLSAGIGSYAGPYTRFAEPNAAGFGWLVADSAGVADTITTASSLKHGWRAVPRADGRGDDLLEVSCHPDFDAPDSAAVEQRFVVELHRYTFDGQRWRHYARVERGFWEDEDEFPAAARFP